MTQNVLNTNTRDLITQAIHDVAQVSGMLSADDPAQPVLEEILNELATLNWQVVSDDISQMTDTINQHLGELENLTIQINATTDDLENLSATLKKVADAVGFLLDAYTQASGLGLLSLLS